MISRICMITAGVLLDPGPAVVISLPRVDAGSARGG